MAAEEFKLVPLLNDIDENFANEVLLTIKHRQRSKKHPILLAWTSRMPLTIHRNLQKAAKKHHVSMTAIQIEALRRLLPALLSTQELRAADAEEREVEREAEESAG